MVATETSLNPNEFVKYNTEIECVPGALSSRFFFALVRISTTDTKLNNKMG